MFDGYLLCHSRQMIHIQVHIFSLITYSFRFAKDLDFETWEATNGFLHRFCMRYGVLSKRITGESLDYPDYTQFMEEVLTPLLMQYEPQDVYNADETSLYYKCLPDRTYAFEHERVRVHVFPI